MKIFKVYFEQVHSKPSRKQEINHKNLLLLVLFQLSKHGYNLKQTSIGFRIKNDQYHRGRAC